MLSLHDISQDVSFTLMYFDSSFNLFEVTHSCEAQTMHLWHKQRVMKTDNQRFSPPQVVDVMQEMGL